MKVSLNYKFVKTLQSSTQSISNGSSLYLSALNKRTEQTNRQNYYQNNQNLNEQAWWKEPINLLIAALTTIFIIGGAYLTFANRFKKESNINNLIEKKQPTALENVSHNKPDEAIPAKDNINTEESTPNPKPNINNEYSSFFKYDNPVQCSSLQDFEYIEELLAKDEYIKQLASFIGCDFSDLKNLFEKDLFARTFLNKNNASSINSSPVVKNYDKSLNISNLPEFYSKECSQIFDELQIAKDKLGIKENIAPWLAINTNAFEKATEDKKNNQIEIDKNINSIIIHLNNVSKLMRKASSLEISKKLSDRINKIQSNLNSIQQDHLSLSSQSQNISAPELIIFIKWKVNKNSVKEEINKAAQELLDIEKEINGLEKISNEEKPIPLIPKLEEEQKENPWKKKYILGRDNKSSIIDLSNDKYISGEHLQVRPLENGTVEICDLKSTNGSWFCKKEEQVFQKLQQGFALILEEGDKIKIGETILIFQNDKFEHIPTQSLISVSELSNKDFNKHRIEFHADEEKVYIEGVLKKVDTDILEKYDLLPKYKIKLSNNETVYSSRIIENEQKGRSISILYINNGKGKYVARPCYSSCSHGGLWQAPHGIERENYNNETFVGWFGKGFATSGISKSVTSLNPELQKAFSFIQPEKVSEFKNIEVAWSGLLRAIPRYHGNLWGEDIIPELEKDFSKFTQFDINCREKFTYELDKKSVATSEDLAKSLKVPPKNSPNFNDERRDLSYEIENPMYGKIIVRVFNSRNNHYLWTFYEQKDTGRAWISCLHNADSHLTSTGLQSQIVQCPSGLTRAPFEYLDSIKGMPGMKSQWTDEKHREHHQRYLACKKHEMYTDYYEIWNFYTKHLPVIQDYYNSIHNGQVPS
ncbi:MAG: FHA domain-containing protein [Candidatus Caenarcaniphilales bacterium]|nr:FHA domain-containing protein [Candidatus Caenarcaniphilales bacterium]